MLYSRNAIDKSLKFLKFKCGTIWYKLDIYSNFTLMKNPIAFISKIKFKLNLQKEKTVLPIIKIFTTPINLSDWAIKFCVLEYN